MAAAFGVGGLLARAALVFQGGQLLLQVMQAVEKKYPLRCAHVLHAGGGHLHDLTVAYETWGTLNDDEITQEMARQTVSQSVPELVEQALRKAGATSDNVTVLALEWETPDTFESTQGVSTYGISDSVFASTIQGSSLDGMGDDLDDLDDAAIERSIAEINEAIRRSAARKA